MTTGKVIPLIILPSETYPVSISVIRKTAAQMSAACQCTANKIPSMVATPLPPRKPTYTGKM